MKSSLCSHYFKKAICHKRCNQTYLHKFITLLLIECSHLMANTVKSCSYLHSLFEWLHTALQYNLEKWLVHVILEMWLPTKPLLVNVNGLMNNTKQLPRQFIILALPLLKIVHADLLSNLAPLKLLSIFNFSASEIQKFILNDLGTPKTKTATAAVLWENINLRYACLFFFPLG